MSELWLPASTAAAAVALTYLFCVRPMRRGNCGMARSQPGRDLDRELVEARSRLATILNEQDAKGATSPAPAATESPAPSPTVER
jgi:hypothetical protein